LTVAFLLGLIIAIAGTATAAKLITGKQIKNGTISEKDLSKAVRKKLAKTGSTGLQGPAGPLGQAGKDGAPGLAGEDGSPDTPAQVRDKLAAVDGTGSGVDADLLDGLESTTFVKGGGTSERFFASGPEVDVNRLLPALGQLFLLCQDGAASMQFVNASGGTVSLWRERASTSQLEYLSVPNLDGPLIFINASQPVADRITAEVATAAASVRWEAWVRADGVNCTFNLLEATS
jgi:hypothetical protein